MNTAEQLDDLTLRWLDAETDAEELAALNSLCNDPTLAERHLTLVKLELDLRSIAREHTSAQILARIQKNQAARTVTGVMGNLQTERAKPQSPRNRFLKWLPAVACATLTVILFIFGSSGTSPAHAMKALAGKLAVSTAFTATMTKEYHFDAPQSSGYVTAEVSGSIACVLRPRRSLLCDEKWIFKNAKGDPIPALAYSREWGSSGDEEWDILTMNGSSATTRYSGPRTGNLFTFSKNDSMLPPSPRQAAYELQRIVENFSGAAYLRWFEKSWQENGVEENATASRYHFKARSGQEVWKLSVGILRDGTLSAIALEQTLEDSNGHETGRLSSDYKIEALK